MGTFNVYRRLKLFVLKPNCNRTAKTMFTSASIFLLPMDVVVGEIVMGVGRDNLGNSLSEETGLLLEYHSNPFRTYTWGTLALFGVI